MVDLTKYSLRQEKEELLRLPYRSGQPPAASIGFANQALWLCQGPAELLEAHSYTYRIL